MSENLQEERKELFKLIASLESVEDAEALFFDLCTYKEIDAMAQRLKAAKLLIEGATYEKIIKTTEISSATLSRVSKCVRYSNGYRQVLKKETEKK